MTDYICSICSVSYKDESNFVKVPASCKQNFELLKHICSDCSRDLLQLWFKEKTVTMKKLLLDIERNLCIDSNKHEWTEPQYKEVKFSDGTFFTSTYKECPKCGKKLHVDGNI